MIVNTKIKSSTRKVKGMGIKYSIKYLYSSNIMCKNIKKTAVKTANIKIKLTCKKIINSEEREHANPNPMIIQGIPLFMGPIIL